ncbi:MAG: protease pro-enzyme activation domain-containing protein, partial [Candidatus Baltobacteraceae bacterium]
MIRSTSLRALAALGGLSMALSACGGGGGGATTALPNTGNPTFSNGSIPSQFQIKEWGESSLQGAQYLGPVGNAHLSANVLVRQQNAAALMQYARDVNDPSSGSFRKWLAPQDIAKRFGASQSDYQSAANYFAQQGLTIGAWPQRMMLSVSGSQTSMERAFNTTFGVYRKNGKMFVGPTTTPHFRQIVPVDVVGNLVAYTPMHTYIINPPRAGAASNLGYSPQLVRAAFDYNNAYVKSFTGTGVTVAIIGTGPIDSYAGGTGDHDLDAFSAFYNHVNVASVHQVNVTASGVAAGLVKSGIPTAAPSGSPPPNGFPFSNAFASPPPVSDPSCKGSLPKCNPEDSEAQLDVQQAASLAPGATLDFYLAYNSSDCTTVTFPNACAPGTGSP